MHQCGEYSLLVGRVVVGPSVKFKAIRNVSTFMEPEYSFLCLIHRAIRHSPGLVLHTKLSVNLLHPNNPHAQPFLIPFAILDDQHNPYIFPLVT
jgi:hypothetical protein